MDYITRDVLRSIEPVDIDRIDGPYAAITVDMNDSTLKETIEVGTTTSTGFNPFIPNKYDLKDANYSVLDFDDTSGSLYPLDTKDLDDLGIDMNY